MAGGCVVGRPCMVGGVVEAYVAGGVHGRGVGHAWQGACVAEGCAWQEGMHEGGMHGRGGHVHGRRDGH